MKPLRRKEFTTVNTGNITAGSQFFPLTEDGSPSDLERREDYPLKNFKVENLSTVQITVLLDPIGLSSPKTFIVPNGTTVSSLVEEDFIFYNISVINDGTTTIPLSKIRTTVRNY